MFKSLEHILDEPNQLEYLQFNQLKRAIPKHWVNCIKEQKIIKLEKFIYYKNLPNFKLKTKDFYDHIIDMKYKQPINEMKWNNDFIELLPTDNELWNKIYKNSFTTIRDTHIQSLQHKLIHRIINCNKKLLDWKIIN